MLCLFVNSIITHETLEQFTSYYDWATFRTSRNRVFAANSDFLIPIFWQPNVVDFRYFKL